MIDDLYQEVILEEYSNPQNKGQLPNTDVKVAETNASCGDEVEVFVKFDQTGQKIQDVKWRGVGCAISMATASIVSQHILGKTRKEVLEIEQHDLEEMLGIPEISPGRVKCLLLALKAFKKAVKVEAQVEQK